MRRGSCRIPLALLVLAAASGPLAHGDPITLYDAQLNTTPNQQGWSFRFLPLVPPVGQTVGGGVVTLDTLTNLNTQAGYFTTDPLGIGGTHPAMPSLDRASGFTVRFDLRVEAEDHGTRVDRAGFSLLALGTDRFGIELGFWTNEVWAQSDNPLFTHAEGSAFDTTSLTRYELSVLGTSYTLFATGSPLLTGPLRNYASFGAPYTTPNQLFLGDNTTSAGARVHLALVSVALAPVPEPASLALLAAGGVVMLIVGHRRR